MANNERDAAKERYWRDVLRRQAASGLSVRAFCLREKLTESGFYAWRRTIGERDDAGGAQRSPGRPAFVPAVLNGAAEHDAPLMLKLTGGVALQLPPATPAERVAELVRALQLPTES